MVDSRRIKEDFPNSSSLASNSVAFRLRNRADRFLRFNLEHIVSLFLERIKLIYNTVVYLHYRLARGAPHASNRTDLRQSRSTIVPVSRPASDTSPGETLLATCNPVFTYFQTPVSTPDRGPTVCTPVFVSSSAKFLARVLSRVSVGNYYERKRKSFGDAKCYVSTMNTFYSNLERGMLRIAIFRNVSPFFFFSFSF